MDLVVVSGREGWFGGEWKVEVYSVCYLEWSRNGGCVGFGG